MNISGLLRGQPIRLALSIGLPVLAVLIIFAPILNANQYGALAAAIQAVAVVPAIVIAATSLVTDSRDKRVDRVLAFHAELTSGSTQEARARLAAHLKQHGVNDKYRKASRDELRYDQLLSRYHDHPDCRPRADATLLLRFFERVNAARIAETTYAPLLVELIDRHAAWWNVAIKDEGDEVPRAPLRELANWADTFANANKARYTYLRNWGKNRERNFD